MKTLSALRLLGFLLGCIGLSGCGQMGPLYLPESEQPAAVAAEPAPAQLEEEAPLPDNID